MKIIIIGPQPPIRGGIADATRSLCEHLGENHTVMGLSFKRLYPSFFFTNQRTDKNTLPKNYSSNETIDALNPVSWWKTAAEINRHTPDRVFFVWWTTYLFPCYFFMKLLIRKPARVAAIVHNVVPHRGDQS